jgi:hypothetical protein
VGIGLSAFKLAFEISPIVLTGGIAASIPGTMLPIIAITESLNFVSGLLSGGDPLDLDDFFAHFVPLSGSTLVEQEIGHYPFANQAVAANAVIADPLHVSLRMICPVKSALGYAEKLATMIALQKAIALHNASGGTYTVATPSAIYTNCLLLRLFDASSSDSAQAQNTWQWDFEKPLLTQEDAASAQNNLMSKITSGVPILGSGGGVSWSGIASTVGVPPSLASSSLVGSAQGQPAATAAGPLLAF